MRNVWVVCLLLAAACGGGGSSTPTAPTVTSIAVTGSDLMLVGNSETFTAAANGGTLAGPRWGSDAPSVATVDAGTGRVTAVGTGTATIYVDANGIRGTKLIRAIPNFGGSWNGAYQLTGCQSSGDFSAIGFCGKFTQGQINNMNMSLTQSRDTITGGFALGSLTANDVSGSVSPQGTMSFTGTVRSSFNIQLQNVRFDSNQNGQMTGTFDQVWSSGTTAASGTARLTAELRGMTRTSGGLNSFSIGNTKGLMSFEEMVAAMRVR